MIFSFSQAQNCSQGVVLTLRIRKVDRGISDLVRGLLKLDFDTKIMFFTNTSKRSGRAKVAGFFVAIR